MLLLSGIVVVGGHLGWLAVDSLGDSPFHLFSFHRSGGRVVGVWETIDLRGKVAVIVVVECGRNGSRKRVVERKDSASYFRLYWNMVSSSWFLSPLKCFF